MFCTKCGSAVDSNAKFCKKCGGALPKASSTTDEVAEQNKASFNQNSVNNPAEPKEQKNRKWLTPFLALLAVCIISALVYALKFSHSSDVKEPALADSQAQPVSVIAKSANETPLKVESEIIDFDGEGVGIPFSDRVDDNDQPSEEAKDFEKNWKGKLISLKYGGVKVSENYVTCEPHLEGLNPNSIITGVLVDRPVGGSGGNPIFLKNCHIEKSNGTELANDVSANLTYDSVVTLRGKLVSASGEGADEKMHNYPALQLEKPMSVLGSDELNVSEEGVKLIQLSLNEALLKQYEDLNGKYVYITGTLFHSDNGHHYTPVLMDTSAIKSDGVNNDVSNLNKEINKNKQQLQANATNKANNFQQLFVCASDMNYLPVAKALARNLMGYYVGGNNLGYEALLNSPASKISDSSLGGGCVQHGFKVDELPDGNKVLYSENDKMLFWIIETKGLAGGAYTAVAEYR